MYLGKKLLNNVGERVSKMIETKQKSSRCVININTKRMKEEKKEILSEKESETKKRCTYIKKYSFDTGYKNDLYQ
jgi:hypothetical protein